MHLEENSQHLHFLSEAQLKRSRKSLLVSMGLSGIIFFIELYGAFASNSLALMSDSFHIVTDFSAHLVSLVALNLSLKQRTKRFNFGYIRFEILAAFLNSILLILMCIFLVRESIHRILDPSEIHANEMLAYSLVGLFMNSLSVLILYRVSNTSINLRSTYIHALGDLLGTVAVVVGALIIRWTGMNWIDPIFSFVIVAIIARATFHLFRETSKSLLEASPDPHKLEHILADIKNSSKVQKVLDYQHWFLTSGVECFNLSILLPDKLNWESAITEMHKILKEDYGITHVSVEIHTKESQAVVQTIHTNYDHSYQDHHSHHHH